MTAPPPTADTRATAIREREARLDRKKLLQAGSAAAVAAAAEPATAFAGGGGSDQGLVGSYVGTITATDPPLGQLNDVNSFHEGGVVTESRRYLVPATPFGTLLETTGHGAWKRTGHRSYRAFFRSLLQSRDTGAPVGTGNVTLQPTLPGDSLTGTFRSQIKDMSDAVLLEVEGTWTGERITV